MDQRQRPARAVPQRIAEALGDRGALERRGAAAAAYARTNFSPEGVAERFGYSVRFLPVGPEDLAVGSPTQMGVFTHD